MKKNNVYYYTISTIILFAIAIIILFFSNGKETRITEETGQDVISSVYCTAGNLESSFFKPTFASKVENEIKVLFKNNVLNQIFYNFIGTYSSNEAAKDDEAVLHAKYNVYLGENDISVDSLSPSFGVVDTKFSVTLYAEEMERVNGVTAQFFFINDDEISGFGKMSKEEMQAFYGKKGFRCEISG